MYSRISSAVLTVLAVAPSISTGPVNCRVACEECWDAQDHPSIVSLYCDMCDECTWARKRRNLARRHTEPSLREVIKVEDAADCPTAPPCSDEDLPTKTTFTKNSNKPSGRHCGPPPICVVKNPPCPHYSYPPPLVYPPPPLVYPPPPFAPTPPSPYLMQPIYLPPPMPPTVVTDTVTTEATTATTTAETTTPETTTAPPTTVEYISVFIGLPESIQLPEMNEIDPESDVQLTRRKQQIISG